MTEYSPQRSVVPEYERERGGGGGERRRRKDHRKEELKSAMFLLARLITWELK